MQQSQESETPEIINESDQITEISRLMGFEQETAKEEPGVEGDEPEPVADAEHDQETVKPGTLKDLAERLKLSTKELYDIQVGMPEGAEPVTLGQLKDLAQQQVDWTERRHQADVERQRIKNDEMQTRQEIAQVLASIPKQFLSPEVIQKARTEWQTYQAAEYQQTLARIPDFDQKQPELLALAKEYGISQAEFESVPDHRFRAVLNDLAELRGKYAKADAMSKEIRTPPKPVPSRAKGKEPQHLAQSRRIRSANTEDKRVSAIADLLTKGL